MKKGIVQILIANIINLFFGIVTGFVLPKYLSVDEYGLIRTFQLYITYIGFLHLGYIDGVYLLYGGKKYNEILTRENKSQIKTFKIFQGIVTFFVLFVAIALKDFVIIIFALSIYPFNLAMYYKLVFQATGEFKSYSYIMNFTTILSVVGIVILMLFQVEDGKAFTVIYLISYIVVAVVADIIVSRQIRHVSAKYVDVPQAIKLIKSGFPLMLGNFSSILMTGMDRWCVKLLIPRMSDFSFYSFAVSLQSMVDAVINPITIVLYNYMCNEEDENKINQIKRLCVLAGCIIIILAFPCKVFVELFLGKYMDSIEVVFILFSVESIYILIRGVYVNLYKAKKRQHIYFKKMIYVIIIAIVLNLGFFYLLKTKEAFAYATLVSSLIWLVMCCKDFKNEALEKGEWIIILFSIISLLLLNRLCTSYLGFLIYFIYVLILAFVFMRSETMNLISIINDGILPKKEKK